MAFNVSAFRDIVLNKGTEVVSASYDGGAPGYTGQASVYKFAKLYFSTDDNDGFDGPYETLEEALGDAHLSFGEVDVSISVTGMKPEKYASLMTVNAPEGHVVEINGQDWVVDESGQVVHES